MDGNDRYTYEAFAEQWQVLSEFAQYNNAVRPVRAICRGVGLLALRLSEAAERRLPQFHTQCCSGNPRFLSVLFIL